MRLQTIITTLFFAILAIAAFSPDEIEIFETHHKLVKQYNEPSFYTFFQISPSAKTKTIIKNFKKLSRKYHPDKIKNATKKDVQRYELLNIVYDVLKSGRRENYDFYLKRGFPKYDKNELKFKSSVFKPSNIFLASFLVIVISILHYVILRISYTTQVNKLQGIIDEIKSTGSKVEDLDLQERRVTSQQLQKDFLIRIDGVFMIEHDEQSQEVLIRLTTDDVLEPSITDVFIINWILKAWNKLSIYPVDLERKAKKREEVAFRSDAPKEQKKKKRTKLPNGKIVYK